MNIHTMPDLVVIGTPAPEASNVLIMSLAGHEIGHSAWRSIGVLSQVENILKDELQKHLNKEKALKQMAEEFYKPLFAADVLTKQCELMMARKAEEFFCDVLGLFLFRDSYIYAFHYLMSPGSESLSSAYPNDWTRVELLKAAAHHFGVQCATGFLDGWMEPQKPIDLNSRMAALTDRVLLSIAPTLHKKFEQLFDAMGIDAPHQEAVCAVQSSLSMGVPYDGPAMLSETIIAGWRRLLELDQIGRASCRERV